MIGTYWQVSSAHITKNDMDLLGKDDNSIISFPNEYGAFVWVPEKEDTLISGILFVEGFSSDFIDIITHAQEIGVTFVRFDTDEPPLSYLKINDW